MGAACCGPRELAATRDREPLAGLEARMLLVLGVSKRRATELKEQRGGDGLWPTIIWLAASGRDVNRVQVGAACLLGDTAEQAKRDKRKLEAPLPLPGFRVGDNGLAELRLLRDPHADARNRCRLLLHAHRVHVNAITARAIAIDVTRVRGHEGRSTESAPRATQCEH